MKVKAQHDDVLIDELEAAMGAYRPYHVSWTEREDAVIRRYYNRVDIRDLAKHVPGRSISAIRGRAGELGVTRSVKR